MFQGFGKLDVRQVELGVDSLSISAHKVHGPKGIGAIWRRGRTPLAPLVSGGGVLVRMRPEQWLTVDYSKQFQV